MNINLEVKQEDTMGHEDKGNYSHKHDNLDADPEIAKKISDLAKDNAISCAAAHKAAAYLKIQPETVGLQIDLAEIQVTHCQVGLFGYPDTGKKFDMGFNVDPELEKKITETAVDGRMSCADAWELAKTFKLKKLDIGSACEILGIKIKPCQLGTF